MDYSTHSNEQLFSMLKDNFQTLSGAMRDVMGGDISEGGDMSSMDLGQLITITTEITVDDFMEIFAGAKDEILRTLDIQELGAQVALENFEIMREILKRV